MTQTISTGSDAGEGEAQPSGQRKTEFPLLVLGALGVVYGDIGTSPIYAFRQAISVAPGAVVSGGEVLGLLSLIVWALTLIVAVKYIFFVTRADNKGEGGTLSLMSLAATGFAKSPRWITAFGVAGAALFFGDAIITPAISVLSATEGIRVIAPGLSRWVVPLTVVIIIGVFSVQRFGTAGVSRVFGPVTAVWFLVLGAIGLQHIIAVPEVLWALNPAYGIMFLVDHAAISS